MSFSDTGFSGKTAVITGAAGGMGLNIALDLVRAGAYVVLIDIKEPEIDLTAQGPGQAVMAKGDITDDVFINQVMNAAFTRTGRLDYLVNAAGVLWFDQDRSTEEVNLDAWDRIISINLKSMVITCRHALPLMRKTGGGAMVHVASVQAMRGDDKPQVAYQASKAGIISLSKTVAMEGAADGIRSNSLLPGPTVSPMQDRWVKDPAIQKATEKVIPLGRAGTTQDMTNATLFLLSDHASYITGTELVVDGGLLARP
ncbi:SDR family NAD(P)-dependent oxidoreductase [Kiloniella laminariae]|uniref:SDR family NAD(P)-dependent oxidoreductase n=1 Tax=Kiloniella laminariae TaxID=454162 RepID=A0ABT4LE75_9PROT|nr:SDR family oxidoreductase [Kiloniella laminariae]MCZ4279396.1 SDR family NAD(P)-dependent oxidoreductase [Kiloniella laminariae]